MWSIHIQTLQESLFDKLQVPGIHGIHGMPLWKLLFLRMVSPGSSKNPLWKSHCWCCGPSRLPQRSCDFRMNDDECTVLAKLIVAISHMVIDMVRKD